jgi:myo-inositol-1(or 4)-monophosphatase
MQLEGLRELALRAARSGAALINAAAEPGTSLDATSKGRGDYVTSVDRAAEEAILAVLREGSPDIPVVAEEAGGTPGPLYWSVDPLDGTANFIRGFPLVGVSVGLVEEGWPIVGAVAAPFLRREWHAARGLGAHDESGRPLHIASGDGKGIVATGFPYHDPRLLPRFRPVLDRALATFEDLRRPGSASLDLTYTAQATFDGFFELGLNPWDIAAGIIVVREAGGVVTDWHGDPLAMLDGGDVLAGSPAWHECMLGLIGEMP